MKVCVVGLGKLGAPLAAVLAAKGHEVVGIDVDAAAVTAIAEGRAPVAEPGFADMLALARPRLGATTDWDQAVAGADASFVIVPTPSEEGGGFSNRHLLEAVGRLVPGVMGNEASADDESFSDGLLEYPHYTRPASFRGWEVPEVLRSGDHGKVARWRRAQALARTRRDRPDLLEQRGGLTDDELRLLAEFDL